MSFRLQYSYVLYVLFRLLPVPVISATLGTGNVPVKEFTCNFDTGLCPGWSTTGNTPNISWISTAGHTAEQYVSLNVQHNSSILNDNANGPSFWGPQKLETNFMYIPKGIRINTDDIWTEMSSEALTMPPHNRTLELLLSLWYYLPQVYVTLTLRFRELTAVDHDRDVVHWMIRGRVHRSIPADKLRWYRIEIPFSIERSGSIVFHAHFGKEIDLIAVDEVMVKEYVPLEASADNMMAKTLSCNFTKSLCGWSNMLDADFTLEPDPSHAYLVAKHSGIDMHPVYNKRDPMLGSIPILFPLPLQTVFSFQYFLSDMGVQYLEIFLTEPHDYTSLWIVQASAETVGRWISVDLPLCAQYGNSIQFQAVIQELGSHVKLANFTYHGELGGSSPRPHNCTGLSCTFDTSFCGWMDRYSTSSRWKRHAFLEDQTAKRPGMFDIVATGDEKLKTMVSVARLVSSCIDIDEPTALSDGQGHFDGDKLIIKFLHKNNSEQFIAVRANETVQLQRSRAIRLVIEHYFLPGTTTVARLPLLLVRNEGITAKASDECPDYPLEPLTTEYPAGRTVSCTFDRNFCGWTNEGEKFYIYPQYSTVLPHIGNGAALALLLKGTGNRRFGPIRSPVIHGKGRTQIFFHYYKGSQQTSATLDARLGNEQIPLWHLDDMLEDKDRIGRWIPVRISYCMESNYTLELTTLFTSYSPSSTGFWIDDIVLNEENVTEPAAASGCNGVSTKTSTSVTCDATLLNSSLPLAFCGWHLTPHVDVLPGIESITHKANELAYSTLALVYRGRQNNQKTTIQLISPKLQGGAKEQLFFWYRIKRPPVFIHATASWESTSSMPTLFFTRNITSVKKVRWWYREGIPLDNVTGLIKVTLSVTFTTSQTTDKEPDFAISHIWYPAEDGFKPDLQIDRLPAYASCNDRGYRNATCSFETSELCSWQIDSNATEYVVGAFGIHPFVVPSSSIHSQGRYVAFSKANRSEYLLESDYIGPMNTRFRFSVFLFGPGLRAFRLYAESMSNYFLLWDAAEGTGTQISARRWQEVQLDLCVKFPFKLVFKIMASNQSYVAALDEFQLLHECDLLRSNINCPILQPSSPFDQPPTNPTNEITMPNEAGNLTCTFDAGSFCDWNPSNRDGETEWSISDSAENQSVAIINCSRIRGPSVTAYLISPNSTCELYPAECLFEFRYKGSPGKVLQVTVNLRVPRNESIKIQPDDTLFDSGPDEFPEWRNATANLTHAAGQFWLIIVVTFFEDDTQLKVGELRLRQSEDGRMGENQSTEDGIGGLYYLLPIFGNLLGIISIAAIVTTLFLYHRRSLKTEYYKRLTFCDVPASLRKDFELPSSAVTLLNHELSISHFCRVGLARMTLPRSKSSTKVSIHVAVKFLDTAHTPEDERWFLAEMATFVRVGKHENIVNLVGIILKGRPMIVMEYCATGSLYQYLQKDTCYSNLKSGEENDGAQNEIHELSTIIYQVAAGMEFLSGRDILHRDLAARNVLLNDSLTAKIGDFGLARKDSEYILQRSNVKLPLGWMAPETLVPMDGRYTDKSDVWSFGVVVWETFAFGQSPYSQQFPQGLQYDTLLQFLIEGKRLSLPSVCPRWMSSIVGNCWSMQAEDRLSFSNIVVVLAAQLQLHPTQMILTNEDPP